MRKTILATAALAALGCMSAAAQPAPTEPAPRACLRFGEIYSWNAPDNYTVIVEDNLHKKFKVRLMSYCPNLTFKERVGFRSPGSMDLSCMSPGDDILVNQFGAGAQRCPISGITAYTPAMEKADKAAAAAKAEGHY